MKGTSYGNIHTPTKGNPKRKMSSGGKKVSMSKRNIIATPARVPSRKV